MIQEWIPLLKLVPASWAPMIVLLLQAMPFVALGLALVKKALGTPDPEHDSALKTAAFYALVAFDWLALNSTPILTVLKAKEDEYTKKRMSFPPGGGR